MKKVFLSLLTLWATQASQYQLIQRQGTEPSLTTQSQAYASNYVAFSGKNGLELPVTLPPTAPFFDYTIQLAFRQKSPTFKKQVIFDIKNGPSCYITPSNTVACNTGNQILQIPDLQAWIQLTYIADSAIQKSKLRLDFGDEFSLQNDGTFLQCQESSVFIGINSELTQHGLTGDVRQFYMHAGTLKSEQAIQALYRNTKLFDTNVMAYYQTNQSLGILNDSFRDQHARVVGVGTAYVAPTLMLDVGQKPVCDILDTEPYHYLPLFDGWSQSPLTAINGMEIVQTQYEYSLSIWLRNHGTQRFSSNEATGITDRHFFLLEGVIAMWWDSIDTFRVYTFATKNLEESSTESVFIPLRQWVNIQVSMDQSKGMLINVYLHNGKLLSSTVMQASELAEQTPTGKIQLFYNFQGEAKSVDLWQKQIDLPVKHTDAGQLVSMHFARENFVGNQWQSVNLKLAGLQGNGFDFYQSTIPAVQEINWASPSQLGMFGTNLTLWDGIGCQTHLRNQVLLDKGSIKSSFQIKQSYEMSVELWFKLPTQLPESDQKIVNLLTLEGLSSSTGNILRSLEVYIEKGVLKCAPFGKLQPQVLSFLDVTNEERWQHVTCGFRHQTKVTGQYLAFNRTSQTEMKDTLPQTFGLSLTNSTMRTPNYLLDMTYYATVGSEDHSIFFKDVRVWNNQRTPEQLYSNRFRQIDSYNNTNLIFNAKLLNGNSTITNEAQGGSTAVITGGIPPSMLTAQSDDVIVCASDRYFDPEQQACVQTPFDDFPIVYTASYDRQYGLTQTYTNKYQRSKLLLPSMQDIFSTEWAFSDYSLFNSSLSTQKTNQNLNISSYLVRDGQQYNVSQTKVSKTHNFWSNITQAVYPRKCNLLVDTFTKEAFTEIVTQRDSSRKIASSAEPVCFTMKLKKIDGCTTPLEDEWHFQPNLTTVESSPYISDLQEMMTLESNSSHIHACLNASHITGLPGNQPINLVFGAYWNHTTEAMSYINAVYSLTVVDVIQAELRASTVRVDLDETVVLDASKSSYRNQPGNKTGLLFKWKCPIEFQGLCDRFEGAPVMEVTNHAFKALGGNPYVDYTFTVEVWSMQSGTQAPSSQHIFTDEVTVRWATFAPPNFDIIVPLLPSQTTPQVVSSQDVSLTVDLKNYRSADPRLTYDWQLYPPVAQSNSSVFLLKQGTLSPNTSYSLKLTISNNYGNYDSHGVNWLNFTTGVPPKAGNLTVTPTSGTMFQSNFNISLSGWNSSTNSSEFFSANIYGITTYEPTVKQIQVGPSMQQINSTGGLELNPGQLPLLVAIKVDVYDFNGERTSLEQPVTVKRPLGSPNWASVTEDIISVNQDQDLLEQKYLYFAFVSQNCHNDWHNGQTSTQDCLDSISQMFGQSAQDIAPLRANDDSALAVRVMTSVITMVEQATINKDLMNTTVANYALNLLQAIPGKVRPWAQSLRTQEFQDSYLQSLSNLHEYQLQFFYDEDYEQEQQFGRRLQESQAQGFINALMVQKNLLLDSLCQMDQISQVRSTLMNLQTQVFSLTDQRTDLQLVHDHTYISLPLDELLRTSQDFSPQATSVCIQVSFIKANPVEGYSYENQQVIEDQTFVQISTLDDRYNRLLQGQGLSEMILDPVLIRYDFNMTRDDFVRNQTVCMGFNTDLSQDWSSDSCETIYTEQGVLCTCQSLKNHYYALITDLTREPDIPVIERFQFTWPFAIVLGLLTLGVITPCLALCLDKCDKRDIEGTKFNSVPDQLLELLKDKRQYSCKQEIFYKLKDLQHIRKWKSVGCCQAYWLVTVNLHPVWSFFRKYDFSNKRVIRGTVLMVQFALVTLITIVVHSLDLVQQFTDDTLLPFFGAALLSLLLLLPPAQLLLYCCHSALVTRRNGKDFLAEVQDYSVFCKLMFIALSMAFYLFVCFVTGLYMMGVAVRQQEMWFRQDQEGALWVVIIWLVTLGCGLVWNEVRIWFILMLASCKAKQIKKIEDTKREPQHQLPETQRDKAALRYNDFVYWLIPHEAVDLILDAMRTIEITQVTIPNLAKQQPAPQPQIVHAPVTLQTISINDVTQDQLVNHTASVDQVNETYVEHKQEVEDQVAVAAPSLVIIQEREQEMEDYNIESVRQNHPPKESHVPKSQRLIDYKTNRDDLENPSWQSSLQTVTNQTGQSEATQFEKRDPQERKSRNFSMTFDDHQQTPSHDISKLKHARILTESDLAVGIFETQEQVESLREGQGTNQLEATFKGYSLKSEEDDDAFGNLPNLQQSNEKAKAAEVVQIRKNIQEDFDLLRIKLKNNQSLLSGMSNDVKLQFYSLGRQGHLGDCNEAKPGFTDVKGRFKWDAWNKLKGMSQIDAQQGFVKLALSNNITI